MATASLWCMYEHNPPLMDESGYLILLGAIGLALGVMHVFCGVRQTIVHEDQTLSRPLWCAAQAYGSGLVMMEGVVDSANPGKYLDSIIEIGCVVAMCICNMNATLSATSELYNRGRG